MRFSLKAIFSVITLACLGALVYQQEISRQRLHEHQSQLKQEIESFDSTLESDLPFLRIAAASDSAFDSLHLQASESLKSANTIFGEKAIQSPGRVSVSHLPTLEASHKSFLIHVPDSRIVTLQIFVSADLFGGDIAQALPESDFNLSKNVNLNLPSGTNRLDLRPDNENGNQWNFLVDDKVICHANSKKSGLSGHQMIWLLSTLDGMGSFRHHNVRGRVSHTCLSEDQKLEFASFVSAEYMRAVVQGRQPTVSKLKCSLLISPKKMGEK